MEEVSKAVNPLLKTLRDLHEWNLAFWSNGSGRPPGFFQMRVQADDERYKRLEEKTVKQSVTLDRIDAFLALEEDRKARHARYWKRARWTASFAGPILGAVIVWLLSWAYGSIAPVVKVLWTDYLHAHPLVMQQLKNTSSLLPSLEYSANKQPTEQSDW